MISLLARPPAGPAPKVPLTLEVTPRMREVLAEEGRKCGLSPSAMAQRLFEAAYAARLGPVGDAALERAARAIGASDWSHPGDPDHSRLAAEAEAAAVEVHELSAGGSPGREGAEPKTAPVASAALPSLGVSSLDLKAASSARVASAEGAAGLSGGMAALPQPADVRTARAFLSVRMSAAEVARSCGWTPAYACACIAAARRGR